MKLVLTLILPAFIILAPVITLFFVRRKLAERKVFLIAILSCFLVGLVTPLLAALVSIQGFRTSVGTTDPQCLTGIGVLVVYAYIFTIFGVPLVGAILFPHRSERLNNLLTKAK